MKNGQNTTPNPAGTGAGLPEPHPLRRKPEYWILNFMNFIMLVLSLLLIVWISVDTFRNISFLDNHAYMTFQFWVCVVFMADFFVQMAYSRRKTRFFFHRIFFLLLSIPYLNIIGALDIHLSHEAIYFVRFIPLARGALAISIVMGYLSTNAVTSMFMSYLCLILMITYFCSLIFYQRESGINPGVTSYWSALWWSAMNITTVGCDITPMTPAGKIVGVILPVCGMTIFPLFTVYLTNYVSGLVKAADQRRHDQEL